MHSSFVLFLVLSCSLFLFSLSSPTSTYVGLNVPTNSLSQSIFFVNETGSWWWDDLAQPCNESGITELVNTVTTYSYSSSSFYILRIFGSGSQVNSRLYQVDLIKGVCQTTPIQKPLPTTVGGIYYDEGFNVLWMCGSAGKLFSSISLLCCGLDVISGICTYSISVPMKNNYAIDLLDKLAMVADDDLQSLLYTVTTIYPDQHNTSVYYDQMLLVDLEQQTYTSLFEVDFFYTGWQMDDVNTLFVALRTDEWSVVTISQITFHTISYPIQLSGSWQSCKFHQYLSSTINTQDHTFVGIVQLQCTNIEFVVFVVDYLSGNLVSVTQIPNSDSLNNIAGLYLLKN